MGIFDRTNRKTSLETAAAEFGQKYAAYSPGERAAVVSLLREIHQQTKNPAFDKLSADLAGLLFPLVPLVSTGNAGDLLILAVHTEAPVLEADLSVALGAGVLEAEIARAASALR